MAKVIIVGARRRRQGIGEFLASAFSNAGAEVTAVVGTTPETAGLAQANLLAQYGIKCTAYSSLAIALEKETPDIVALCTPFESHLEQLQLVLAAGAHCLCEKPIIWGLGARNIPESTQVIDNFIHNKRYLSLVTQWPYTLNSFYEIYPEQKDQPVSNFEMTLSPIRPGPDMVLDAAPHIISMLQALVGDGSIENIKSGFTENEKSLVLDFDYKQTAGANTRVKFRTTVCEDIPRPASYGINGHVIAREIELPDYNIWFQGKDKRIPASDPLNLLVADFLANIKNKNPVDYQALITSITALDMLYKSVLDENQSGS